MTVISTSAPSTSPVIPPSRRTAPDRHHDRGSQSGGDRDPDDRPERSRPGQYGGRERDRDQGIHGSGHHGAEPAAARGRNAPAAGPGERQPPGHGGGSDRGHTAAERLGLGQRGDLDQQREHERDHAERPDVGALHDLQRLVGRAAAAQSVGQVGQPVQVQAPAAGGERRDRERGGEQRAGVAEPAGQLENGGCQRAEQQPDRRGPGHRGARGPPGRSRPARWRHVQRRRRSARRRHVQGNGCEQRHRQ